MATLRLHVDGGSEISPGAPLVASVLNEDLEPVAEVTVLLGETREIEVEAGSYLVRAVAPAGSTLTERTSVGPEGSAEVELGHVPSPSDRLEWHALLGDVLPAAPPVAEPATKELEERPADAEPGEPHASATFDVGPGDAVDVGADTTVYAPAPPAPEALRDIWIRVWRRRDDGEWVVERVRWATDWDGEYATARAEGLEPAQRVLQLGGEWVPWRLVALPATRRLDVLMQSAASAPELDAGVDVSVATDESRGEVLLRYLARGRAEAAHVVAEEILMGPAGNELESPTTAVVLGYYLLQRGELDRLDDRGITLTRRFPELPDGWIIEGSRALRRSDVETGRAHLVRAASLGVPLYSEGMRLLSTGLRLLAARGEGGPEVDRAMATVAGLAAGTNWTEPLTSFYGPDPASPTLSPPIGIPDGPLTWMGPERGGPVPPQPQWPRRLLASAVVAAVIAGVAWWATRGAGELAANPTSLSFGEQTIEAPSAALTVTITNDTGAAVAFRDSRTRGSAADDFTVTTDTCSGAEVPDGRACSLLVVFTPSTEGPRQARLVLRRGGENGRITVPLEGVGVSEDDGEVEGTPRIVVDPTSIVFPADIPEGGATGELTITNDGAAPLDVAASIDPEGEGFALAGLEGCAEIEVGGSCTLVVSFAPFRGTRGEANVVIESNATDEPLQVPLAGTPRAAASPAEVNTTGWDGSQTTVAVANTGTRVFTPVLSIRNERFTIASHNCDELSIGGECVITIAYDAEGAFSSEDVSGELIVEDGVTSLVVPLRYPTPVD